MTKSIDDTIERPAVEMSELAEALLEARLAVLRACQMLDDGMRGRRANRGRFVAAMDELWIGDELLVDISTLIRRRLH